MPQVQGQVHVDRPLTNVSLAFLQDQKDFVAMRAFPFVPVAKQSDKYFTYPKQQFFRTDAKKRGPGEPSVGTHYTLSQDSYSADVFGVHTHIDRQTKANADAAIDLGIEASELVTRHILLRQEKDWVDTFFQTGVWATDTVPATKWDDPSSSPIAEVEAQLVERKSKTGFRPNKIIMGERVWSALKNNPDYLERIKHTQGPAIVSQSLLAAVWGVDEVMVAGAVEDSANEGAAEALDFVAGNSLLAVYAPKTPGLRTPSGGYTFGWTGLEGANPMSTAVSRWFDMDTKSEKVEAESAYDQKLVSASLGAFFDDVLLP